MDQQHGHPTDRAQAPRILGLGGSLRRPSQSESALIFALSKAHERGAETRLLSGDALELPLYPTHRMDEHPRVIELLEALRWCNGLVIASPAYHGTVSGAVKNALDYVQYLAHDPKPFLDGRPIGAIATGDGSQGVVQTLDTIRTISHALRAWPTPLAVAVHEASRHIRDGEVHDEHIRNLIDTMMSQVVTFIMGDLP